MSEELLHTLFGPPLLKVVVNRKTSDARVTVRAAQQHLHVVNRAAIAFTNVNHDAGVFVLLESHFTTLFLWLEDQVGFRDQQLLFVKVTRDFDNSAAGRMLQRLADALVNALHLGVTDVLVHNKLAPVPLH